MIKDIAAIVAAAAPHRGIGYQGQMVSQLLYGTLFLSSSLMRHSKSKLFARLFSALEATRRHGPFQVYHLRASLVR
jgi:hypothetical protein